MRSEYCENPIDHNTYFDAELVDSIFSKMKHGKAAGLDGIFTEHLIFCQCHPLLPAVLAKLFNLMIRTGHVPASFGMSSTVPSPKSNASRYSKSLSVDDFRGISISPVLSKVFEHCLYLIVIVNTSSPVTVSLDLNANQAVRMQFILYDQ